MKLVYVVDDDFDTINSISIWLKNHHFGVKGFTNSVSLYQGIDADTPDVILLDVLLGAEDGRQVCKEIRKRYRSQIPIILFSMAFNSFKEVKGGFADDFIRKDVTLKEITDLLKVHMKVEEE